MVVGQGRIDGRRAVVQGDDFTVRGGAADAAIWQKMVFAERMAHDLRLPLVRLVDGTGGGGSVKSLETMGFTYVPFVPGFELTAANLSIVPGRRGRARPGRRPRRRAGRGVALLGDRQGHRAAIRRRPARGRRGDGRDARQGGARRRPRPGACRRGRQHRGRRRRRARPAATLPLLPARERLGGAPGRRGGRPGRPARGGARDDRPARPPHPLRGAAHPRARVRHAAACSRWASRSAGRS